MRSLRRPALTALLAVTVVLAAVYGLHRLSKARCLDWAGPVVCRVETQERLVALTFDDGPTARGVDAVLPVLKARGFKATFFLIGRETAERPELAARLKAEGHELGNHGWSHVRMVGRPRSFYEEEIARTDALLRAAGETRPTLFRPPYGRRLWGLHAATDRAAHRVVTWDVEPDSFDLPTPEAYAEHVLERVRPGSIVLMHPMYASNETARAALPLVLDGLAARGYRVTTVSELLAAAGAP